MPWLRLDCRFTGETRGYVVSISFSDDLNDESLRELLAAAARRETEATAQLFRQFEGLVNFYAALWTSGFKFRSHDVHDIVMDSWVVILRRLASFSPPAEGVVRAWQNFIQRIVHNNFLNALRKQPSAGDSVPPSNHYDTTPSKILDDAEGIVTQAHQRDILDKCLVAISELDPKDRMVLHKRYSEHKDLQQIADEMGESKAAVTQRLMRVREKLKKFLPKSIDGE